MRNTIGNRTARVATSEKASIDEIKVKMVMRIYHASRARALEIIDSRVAEKAAKEAEDAAAKEAEEAARNARIAATREMLRRRCAERNKFRAECG